MSTLLIQDTELTAIANAIRSINGETQTYTPAVMAQKISALSLISLSSITIVTPPSKTSYKAGEFFSPTGMSIQANYSNGATKIITDYTYEPTGALEDTDTNIAISYTENGITKTVNQQVSVSLVEKGQVITMNLDGSNKQYRVLKVNGTVAEVLAQFQYGSNTRFNNSTNTYTRSTLDTYMNTTYYNTLSTEAKNAIIDKSLIQYEYVYSASAQTANHASTADYSTKTQKATVGNRHCYTIGVEDIEEYFDGIFTSSDLTTMFNMTRTQNVWLNSAAASSTNTIWSFNGTQGAVGGYGTITASYGARPAFQIDLSQISWS